jgi:hypothetical protein
MPWKDTYDELPHYGGTIVYRQLNELGGRIVIEVMPNGVACIVTVGMPDAFVRIWRPNEEDARGILESLKAELENLFLIKKSASNDDAYFEQLQPWVRAVSARYDATPRPNKP